MRKTASLAIWVVLTGLAASGVLALAQASTRLSATSPVAPQITATPTPCPQATPELFYVEPITSPTTSFSQTVTIYIGNREWVRVETESGVFTSTTPSVGVALLPNTTHHLTATGKVIRVGSLPGCVYGDYTLSTTRDKNNKPLQIQQLGMRRYLPIVLHSTVP